LCTGDHATPAVRITRPAQFSPSMKRNRVRRRVTSRSAHCFPATRDSPAADTCGSRRASRSPRVTRMAQRARRTPGELVSRSHPIHRCSAEFGRDRDAQMVTTAASRRIARRPDTRSRRTRRTTPKSRHAAWHHTPPASASFVQFSRVVRDLPRFIHSTRALTRSSPPSKIGCMGIGGGKTPTVIDHGN